METIEDKKHGLALEKQDIEQQRIDAAEKHDQLLCDMEKAKLALEQEKIDLQKCQQQHDYELKCQL